MQCQKISASVIGELLLDELPYWSVGICRVEAEGDDMVVYGENDHPVARIDTKKHMRESPFDGADVVNTEAVAAEVNEAIEWEHDAL